MAFTDDARLCWKYRLQLTRASRCLLVIVALCALGACDMQQAEDVPIIIAANDWPGYYPLNIGLSRPENRESFRFNVVASTSEAMRSFRNGRLDAICVTLDEALKLADEGIDAQIVMLMDVSDGADALLVKPSIDSAASLLENGVLGVEKTALGAYMLSRFLRVNNLTAQGLRVVNIPYDEHLPAYDGGRIDAVITFDPVRSELLKKGARILFDSADIPNEIMDVLVVRGEVIRDRAASIKNLIGIWGREIALYAKNADDYVALMEKTSGHTQADIRGMLQGLRYIDGEENARLFNSDRPVLISRSALVNSVMVDAHFLKSNNLTDKLFSAPGLYE